VNVLANPEANNVSNIKYSWWPSWTPQNRAITK
jgi:hypothetical protein